MLAEFDREGVLEYHLVEPAAEVFPDFFGEGFSNFGTRSLGTGLGLNTKMSL